MGWVPSAQPRKLSAHDASEYCQSPITGTDKDIAPCLLTELTLGDNNLVGDLGFTVHTFEDGYGDENISSFPSDSTWITMRNLTFAHLANFDVANNVLSGPFPFWFTELEYLQEAHLKNSEFDYSENAVAAVKQMCNRGNLNCLDWSDSGLPPISCTAFGQSVAVIPPQRATCYFCPRAHNVALWWVILVVIVWGMSIGFGVMALRQLQRVGSPLSAVSPELAEKVGEPSLSTDDLSASVGHPPLNTYPFKRWIAGAVVVSVHVQSLIIVGGARANWPVGIKRALACMALDYTCFTSSACLTNDTPTLTENFDAQFYTNLAAMVMLLVPLGLSWYLNEQLRHHSLTVFSDKWRRKIGSALYSAWLAPRTVRMQYARAKTRARDRVAKARAKIRVAKVDPTRAKSPRPTLVGYIGGKPVFGKGRTVQVDGDVAAKENIVTGAVKNTQLATCRSVLGLACFPCVLLGSAISPMLADCLKRGMECVRTCRTCAASAGNDASKSGSGRLAELGDRFQLPERHISTGSNVSLVCSAFLFLSLAVSFRISRQLCAYGAEFGRTAPIVAGLILLFMQTPVWRAHFLDAKAYLQGRKGSTDQTKDGVVRTAFVVQPFKQRRADWMAWMWLKCAVLFLIAWFGFYNGTDYGYAIMDPTMQSISNTLVIILLIVIWAITSLIEPYEYTFLNTLDSRVSICAILFLIVGMIWEATAGDEVVCGNSDSCRSEDLLLEPLSGQQVLELLLTVVMVTVAVVALLEVLLGLAASYQSAEAWNGVVNEYVPIWIRGMRWEDAPLFAGSIGVISLHATGSETGPDAEMVLKALQESTPAPSPMDAENELERSRAFAAIFPHIMEELIEERHGRSLLEKVMRYGAKQTIEMHRAECQHAHDLVMDQIAIEFDPNNAICMNPSSSSRTAYDETATPVTSQRSWLDRQLAIEEEEERAQEAADSVQTPFAATRDFWKRRSSGAAGSSPSPFGQRGDSVSLDLIGTPKPPTPRQKLGDRDGITLSFGSAAQPPSPRQQIGDRDSITFAIDPTAKPPSPSKLPSRRTAAPLLGAPLPLATVARRASRSGSSFAQDVASPSSSYPVRRASGSGASSASESSPPPAPAPSSSTLPPRLQMPQSPKETQRNWLDRQLSQAGVLPPPPLERGKPEEPASPPPSPPLTSPSAIFDLLPMRRWKQWKQSKEPPTPPPSPPPLPPRRPSSLPPTNIPSIGTGLDAAWAEELQAAVGEASSRPPAPPTGGAGVGIDDDGAGVGMPSQPLGSGLDSAWADEIQGALGGMQTPATTSCANPSAPGGCLTMARIDLSGLSSRRASAPVSRGSERYLDQLLLTGSLARSSSSLGSSSSIGGCSRSDLLAQVQEVQFARGQLGRQASLDFSRSAAQDVAAALAGRDPRRTARAEAARRTVKVARPQLETAKRVPPKAETDRRVPPTAEKKVKFAPMPPGTKTPVRRATTTPMPSSCTRPVAKRAGVTPMPPAAVTPLRERPCTALPAAAPTPFPKRAVSPMPKVTATPIPKGNVTPMPKRRPTPLPKASVAPVPPLKMTPMRKATPMPMPDPTLTPMPKAAVTQMPKAAITPMPKAATKPMPKAAVTPMRQAAMTPMPKRKPTAMPKRKPTAMPKVSVTPIPKRKPIAMPKATVTPMRKATTTPMPKRTLTALPKRTVAQMPKASVTPMPKRKPTPMPKAPATRALPKYLSTPMPKRTPTAMPKATTTPMPKATATPMPKATATPMPKRGVTPMPTASVTPLPRREPTAMPVRTVTPMPKREVTPMPPARKRVALFPDMSIDLPDPAPKPAPFQHPKLPLPLPPRAPPKALPKRNVTPMPVRPPPEARQTTRLPKRKVDGRELKLHLERDPPQPPQASSKTSAQTPASLKEFLEKQVDWLRVTPSMVSDDHADGIQTSNSAWPRAASRHEPTAQDLDGKMEHVALICRQYNYGLKRDSMSPAKALIELGYSLHLCVHQHRNAHVESTRAARIWQKWYVVVVDWQAVSRATKTGERQPLLVENEWLGRWNGRSLRAVEPNYSGGPDGMSMQQLQKMAARGKAIVYDNSFNNVVVFPKGSCARLLHRMVGKQAQPNACVRHFTDLGCCDNSAVWRAALSGKKPKRTLRQVVDEPLTPRQSTLGPKTMKSLLKRKSSLLEVGQVVVGSVKQVNSMGAVVDVGDGRQGTLQASDAQKSNVFIDDLRARLNVDDKLTLRVKTVDEETGDFTLTAKRRLQRTKSQQLRPSPEAVGLAAAARENFPPDLNQVQCDEDEFLRKMLDLLPSMSGSASVAGPPLSEADRKQAAVLLGETAALVANKKASLGRLASFGRFPKLLRTASGFGVSVHLCASETTHMFGEAARESTVWLTFVDLSILNPVDASRGGLLTPPLKPYDNRTPYVVPGEVRRQWLPPVPTRADTEDEEEVLDTMAMLRTLQARRLDALEKQVTPEASRSRPVQVAGRSSQGEKEGGGGDGGGLEDGSAPEGGGAMVNPCSRDSRTSRCSFADIPEEDSVRSPGVMVNLGGAEPGRSRSESGPGTVIDPCGVPRPPRRSFGPGAMIDPGGSQSQSRCSVGPGAMINPSGAPHSPRCSVGPGAMIDPGSPSQPSLGKGSSSGGTACTPSPSSRPSASAPLSFGDRSSFNAPSCGATAQRRPAPVTSNPAVLRARQMKEKARREALAARTKERERLYGPASGPPPPPLPPHAVAPQAPAQQVQSQQPRNAPEVVEKPRGELARKRSIGDFKKAMAAANRQPGEASTSPQMAPRRQGAPRARGSAYMTATDTPSTPLQAPSRATASQAAARGRGSGFTGLSAIEDTSEPREGEASNKGPASASTPTQDPDMSI